MFCPYCGKESNAENVYCPSCGSQLFRNGSVESDKTHYDQYDNYNHQNYNNNHNNHNNYNQHNQKERPAAKLDITGSVIFSVINMICCIFPLGLISLILTILSKDALTLEEGEKKLRIAMILNIVGLALGVLIIICYFIFILFLRNLYY